MENCKELQEPCAAAFVRSHKLAAFGRSYELPVEVPSGGSNCVPLGLSDHMALCLSGKHMLQACSEQVMVEVYTHSKGVMADVSHLVRV